jgi:DNA-binding MarR family transcriptional regulator
MHGLAMVTKPLDTLLALKALCLHGGLTSNERRVGAALIEHFNRRTSQCDPSMGRLAGLLGIHKRTVLRAIDGLEAAGLFKKIRHGGYSGRNFYVPIWSSFRAICEDWDRRMKRRTPKAVTELAAREGHDCRVVGDVAVDQTCESNPINLTCSGLPSLENGEARPKKTLNGRIIKDTRARHSAEHAAERRWSAALHKHFASRPVTYGEVVGLITPAIQEAATQTEMQKPGSGFNYILDTLCLTPPQQGDWG